MTIPRGRTSRRRRGRLRGARAPRRRSLPAQKRARSPSRQSEVTADAHACPRTSHLPLSVPEKAHPRRSPARLAIFLLNASRAPHVSGVGKHHDLVRVGAAGARESHGDLTFPVHLGHQTLEPDVVDEHVHLARKHGSVSRRRRFGETKRRGGTPRGNSHLLAEDAAGDGERDGGAPGGRAWRVRCVRIARGSDTLVALLRGVRGRLWGNSW